MSNRPMDTWKSILIFQPFYCIYCN
uniref:Uncharacterized protein n=1 Tax=Anguilla anguilla TaxID=7936 RepID=A0A0E9QYU0_ANGAN